MNEEKNLSKSPTHDGDESVLKMIWLFAAFIPGAIGIACLHLKNPGRWLFPLLIALNLMFSVAASVGLVHGMKDGGVQFIIGLFLAPFFFVLNTLIVLFVGCSGMGRIAP